MSLKIPKKIVAKFLKACYNPSIKGGIKMLIYMNCLFYKEKNQWVVEDDITHKIIHRTSIFKDFNEFEFIRHYRENQKKKENSCCKN